MATKLKPIELAVRKIKGRFDVIDKSTGVPIVNTSICTVNQQAGEDMPTATIIIRMPISE